MIKVAIHSASLVILMGVCSPRVARSQAASDRFVSEFRQFSQSVDDTFHINVQVPQEYFTDSSKKYPTVLLLDGNFYFPMMAPIVRQYEVTGLLPPLILVSVGYASFQAMDSLRVRDYLFPKALPSDEMEAIGGGKSLNLTL